MLKKSVIAAALVMFTTSAFALDGGQLDFAGLVSDNTCALHVNGGAQDGQITLQTATTSEVNDTGVVRVAAPGAKPKAFSITIDCSGAPQSSANLSMGSVFFSNSQGTLNNDLSISQAATGVAIAIHYLTDATTYQQMRVNDSTDVKNQLFTNGKAVYNFKASYVKQAATIDATAGYVKTNAAYTVTYQ
ncbi:fimbrial protein [Escherichia albertii]|nr:fimbrial protein [Escherichia albertii]